METIGIIRGYIGVIFGMYRAYTRLGGLVFRIGIQALGFKGPEHGR